MKKGHFHSMMTVQECSRSHTTPPFYTYYVNGNDENEMRVRSNFSNFPRFQLLREDRSPGFHISISQKRQKLKRKFTFSFWKRKVKILGLIQPDVCVKNRFSVFFGHSQTKTGFNRFSIFQGKMGSFSAKLIVIVQNATKSNSFVAYGCLHKPYFNKI